MYTTEDFAELDKTNFKSYKFPNGNIYYGETALMSPSQTIVTNPEEITDEEEKNALKLVRHGNGVQLYNVQDTKCDCKYEGSWEFEKKKEEVQHMGQFIKENFLMVNLKVSENLFGKLIMFILEIVEKEKWKVLENLNIKMEKFFMDIYQWIYAR